MELKFSVFTEKVRRYEKLTTLRLWSVRKPPALGDEIDLVACHESEPMARGLVVLVVPIILTREQLYIHGRLAPPDILEATAIADGFDSLDTFWMFFHLELERLHIDASSGWLIRWKPSDP
jgi:hypothetical protein